MGEEHRAGEDEEGAGSLPRHPREGLGELIRCPGFRDLKSHLQRWRRDLQFSHVACMGGGKPFDAVPVVSALDDDVLALDVPEFPQPLKKSRPDVRGLRAGRRGTPEKADPIDFRGRLRLTDERRKN
jgi:hypothetical protein